jgi:hypothetical protein
MAFSIANITQPYTPMPVKIGDTDGTHTLTFSGLFAPKVDPNSTWDREVRVTRTRPGRTHPAYRIFGSFGATANDRDISLTLDVVVPSALAQLQNYHDGRPGTFLLTLGEDKDTGSGQYFYFVMFKPKGLKIQGYDWNQRVFNKVTLELYIIQETTQTFGG